MPWDYAVIIVCTIVGAYLAGYYKGKVDSWNEAYTKGEKSGWNQAQRRML